MNVVPEGLVYSTDPELVQRLVAYLSEVCRLNVSQNPSAVAGLLHRSSEVLFLLDLRAPRAREILSEILEHAPSMAVIAFGTPRSDPFREAEALRVFAVENLDADADRLRLVVRHALMMTRLRCENKALREKTHALLLPSAAVHSPREPKDAAWRHLTHALREFDDVDALLRHLMESVAISVRVARAGIVMRDPECRRFVFRTGLRCLEETRDFHCAEHDPLVRWMERHAHMISRLTLHREEHHETRMMLQQTLEWFGAEVILPLYARGRVSGWLFLGNHVTGLPFEYEELEELSVLSDQVATVIENATLYREIAVQKIIAETLLHAMPDGIVGVSESGRIRWFNHAAGRVLGMDGHSPCGREVEHLGGVMAGAPRRTLAGSAQEDPLEWVEPHTHRTLSVTTRRLHDHQEPVGALALIRDVTAERMLRDKTMRVERSTFWNEMAAAMGHEINNPLVTIKTYAQILPEQYQDEEFRNEFSGQMLHAVEQLQQIVNQMRDFALPPALRFRHLNVLALARRTVKAFLSDREGDAASLTLKGEDSVPLVMGDEKTLTDLFRRLTENAVENRKDESALQITLSFKTVREEDGDWIWIVFSDNGRGIPQADIERVFSPLFTTKAKGMGLGLPIAWRSVVDHNGRIHVDSSPTGTQVNIALPSESAGNSVVHTPPGTEPPSGA